MARPRKHGKIKTQINGEIVFRQLYGVMGEAGSWAKVARWYNKEHGVNDETSKPFSRMGMELAAWRWVLFGHDTEDLSENGLEEGFEIFKGFYLQMGEHYTKEQWKKDVWDKSKLVITSKNRRNAWNKAHPDYVQIEPVK